MRLFVALDIDDQLRARIAGLIADLRHAMPDVKWVKPESVHVTLKFIGEFPDHRRPALEQALAGASVPGPFELSFEELGCFPNERSPRVFWVGIQAPPELGQLAESVESACERLGIQRDKRAFSPHLTLGRAREGGPPIRIAPRWEAHRHAEFGRVAAREFYLYRSQLSPGGAQYTRLRSFPLRLPSDV
jgi:RNA 2',3'-cyclic 3'-phosphodiesterase